MVRRLVPVALIVALFCATMPAQPALALSTSNEVQLGKQIDESIVAGSVVETDPLLTKWANDVASKVWAQTARKDIPYNLKVLDDSSVNAFATLGGYLYVDEGALDFVQSDDELAGLIGHETGHVERRHVVSMQSKSQAINLLFGIASLFSPFIYHFGQLMQAGLMAKMSRIDELQADQYGLLLMSRAGYDPEAMVSLLNHLGALDKERPDLLTKYLEDHPEPDKRVSHLMGYDQLDPTKVSNQELLVQGIHDFDTARYSIATIKLQRVLKADPQNSQALLALGQSQLALGQVGKSEQTLAEAAQTGSQQTRDAANSRIAGLRAMERARVSLTQPNRASLIERLQNAQTELDRANSDIGSRRDSARDQLRSLSARLDTISYEIPQFSNLNMSPGSRTEAVYKNVEAMSRSINNALDHNQIVVKSIGSNDRNKSGGTLKESQDILHELQAAFDQKPMTADTVSELPSYPRMLGEMNASDDDLVRAVDASRGSIALMDTAMGSLDEFLKALNHALYQRNFNDELNTYDYNSLVPMMQKTRAELDKAAAAASEATQLYNMARARQLETRITMLGLGTSPQRFATLQKALEQRVGSPGIDYTTMLHEGLTPGEAVSAAIVAADTNSSAASVIQESRSSHRSIVDVANNRGMHEEALEIFLGLVYLDYTDDPQKELSTG